MASSASPQPPAASAPDRLVIGRRIRRFRISNGMTLDDLGAAIGRAASQVSVIENGKRELKLAELHTLAEALGTTLPELISDEPLDERDALEVALERIQRGPVFSSLHLPPVPIRKSLPTAAIRAIVALHGELSRLHEQRAATPEEARRANTQLRAEQRACDNYYPDLERTAGELLAKIGHRAGPLPQRAVSELAAHLGFSLHYVHDLPVTTRSITDHRNGRIYLPIKQTGTDPRSALLQALSAYVLGQPEPQDYGDLLRQRVETNYLAGALLIAEQPAVEFLVASKRARELSVEDLRDAFAVNFETAAHRFTNLSTRHLGIPVHFLKVHSSGAISKAYENDDVQFPVDPLGSVEGQRVCRWWSARQVFTVEDRMSPYSQYTDKPVGTYWCTSSLQSGATGDFSVSLGTRFSETKWFRGRDTSLRQTSACPDPTCCRQPDVDQVEYWNEEIWPSARINSSLLAAMPDGSTSGIDHVSVYEFLDRHSGRVPS